MENTDVVSAINALAEAQDNALEAADARHKTEIRVLTEKLEEQDNRSKKRLRRNNLVWLLIWVISLFGFDKIAPYLRPIESMHIIANNAIVWDNPHIVREHWHNVGLTMQDTFIDRMLARNCKDILELFRTDELKLSDHQKESIVAHTRKKKQFMHDWEAEAFDEGWAAAMQKKHNE